MHMPLNLLATASTEPATVESGIEACFDALGNITELITVYPFNMYFGLSVICVGIAIFAKIKGIF